MSTYILHSPPAGAARTHSDPARGLAVALLLAVVIVEAVLIALAAPHLADIGALYTTTT